MTAKAPFSMGRLGATLLSLSVLFGVVASGDLECAPSGAQRAVLHGEELYGRMCAVCHGAAGEGYKADQAPALAQKDFLRTVSDPFLTEAITGGRSGSTMSAWGVSHGGPLAPSDVAAVVAYLRTWQKDDDATLDNRPPHGDAKNGEVLYMRECQTCHGERGAGHPYESIGNATLLRAASDGFLRAAIEDGRPPTAMVGFKSKLGEAGVEDILTTLRAWEASAPKSAIRSAPPARPPPLPLGPVPLHANGPEPIGFSGGFTKADVVHKELSRGAKMGILDARAPSDYAREHIEGAVSVPFYDPSPYLKELPHDAWLVCYCGCPHAESGQLAQKLRDAGFVKVTVIDEGLGYWAKKGYGTHTGVLP